MKTKQGKRSWFVRWYRHLSETEKKSLPSPHFADCTCQFTDNTISYYSMQNHYIRPHKLVTHLYPDTHIDAHVQVHWSDSREPSNDSVVVERNVWLIVSSRATALWQGNWWHCRSLRASSHVYGSKKETLYTKATRPKRASKQENDQFCREYLSTLTRSVRMIVIAGWIGERTRWNYPPITKFQWPHRWIPGWICNYNP